MKKALIVAALVVLVAAYSIVAFLTRSTWSNSPPQHRTTVTFSAQSPEGAAPSPDELAQANEVLLKRVSSLGLNDTEIATEANQITLTASGDDTDALREIGDIGRLYVRPVIHAIPSKNEAQDPAPPPSSPPSARYPDLAQRIADEKELRQSTDPQIQLLSLQFQATRCADEDLLANNDDPDLPLITCSADTAVVYLLDTSILSGDQITAATAQVDDPSGQNTVFASFDAAGAETLAGYSEANIGTQVAYTLDSRVISAPEIQEEIPNGRAVIAGNFSAMQARALAANLGGGALPLLLSFESSRTEQIPVANRTLWRVGLFAGATVVTLALVAGVTYLIVGGRRRYAAPPGPYRS